jgi:hypothetical protein
MYVYNSQENALYQKFVENNGRGLVSLISKNFKIKVYGLNLNKLVGVFGLLNLLGTDLTLSLLNKALLSDTDVYTCRLRRGLKVSFYSC